MADDPNNIEQDEIEQLLKQQGGQDPPDASASSESTPEAKADGGTVGQDEIEALLNQGQASGSAAESSATEDGDKALGQDEIEAMMAASGGAPPPAAATQKAAPSGAGTADDEIAQDDIELLLKQAETALASVQDPSDQPDIAGLESFRLEEFRGAPASEESATLDLIRDVELNLRIELGRTHMHLEDILKLRKGSVVPLDKLAGDPVDVYVNGRLIARGEVLVLNDNFCVRVAELLSGETARAG